jgi:phage terminase Nu1 subunit (DNA packaging protein)
MGTLIVKDIPDEVKNKFKAVCAERGKTIKEELIRLMKKEVEKHRGDKL